MSRRAMRRWSVICVTILGGIGLVAALQAARPRPDRWFIEAPDVPVFEDYDWVPELGGWLDNKRRIVWGYSVGAITNTSYSYAGAANGADNYVNTLLEYGYDEAAYSADGLPWRVPTLAEHQEAFAKGLFTYGDGMFNWDSSPEDGFQPIPWGQHWCSDPATKGKNADAWFFNLSLGEYGQTGVGSFGRGPVVVYSLP